MNRRLASVSGSQIPTTSVKEACGSCFRIGRRDSHIRVNEGGTSAVGASRFGLLIRTTRWEDFASHSTQEQGAWT
jgi:hypothetical protein